MLVQKGAAVNVSSRYWNHATSLHYCSQLGKLENIKLLLNYGANVFIKDKCGQTARERAHKHPECEKLLWEKEGVALSWSAFQKLELARPVILKMKLLLRVFVENQTMLCMVFRNGLIWLDESG